MTEGASRAVMPVEGNDLTDKLARASVLVVDDEPGMRNFLCKTLAPYCQVVEEADSVDAAEAAQGRRHFDVVILDNMMPGRNGIAWLTDQRRQGKLTDTIMITAYADLETAIEAMRAGAVDFVLKPFRSNQVLNAVRRCMEVAELRRENALLRHELRNVELWRRRRELLGSSERIEAVRQTLARVARMPTPVLLLGEPGTGKEVAARHLHALSDRAARPFVPVNCAAVGQVGGGQAGFEADLFGRPEGAERGESLLASAAGGTVYLDEVADLSATAQRAIVRLLEGRVDGGAMGEAPRDLRFVFASSKDLAAEVAAGRLREDLYFRINVVEITLPPLRQRGADSIVLAEMFAAELSAQLGLAPIELDAAARAAILRHRWPGNIRELRNFVERSLIFGRLSLETLGAVPRAEIEPLEVVERRQILAALEATAGNRTDAARRLGVSRKTIDRKMAAWGL
jgi:DNA-binding NtrC family response regulator